MTTELATAGVANLTQREVAVLSSEYNLADGHAYRRWTEAELAIIASTSTLMREVDRRRQPAIEQDYFESFFRLAGQTLAPGDFVSFACFTASSAIEVIANYLRLANRTVTLVEPCFDNLPDALKRHGVPLTALDDNCFDCAPAAFEKALAEIATDVIFVVSPNNPTGRRLGRQNFQRLVAFCKDSAKMLVLDACFRFYVPTAEVFDQYAILLNADIDWIVIEDTGKTWPTLELKAPFFCASRSVASHLAHIYSDFVLHVSPFSVRLLTEFLRVSQSDGLESIRGCVRRNRVSLWGCADALGLVPTEDESISVSWLRASRGETATQVQTRFADAGVSILAGTQFFWSRPPLGEEYVRVALARDNDLFDAALARVQRAVARV